MKVVEDVEALVNLEPAVVVGSAQLALAEVVGPFVLVPFDLVCCVAKMPLHAG